MGAIVPGRGCGVTAETIARSLGGRRSGSGYVCRCPSHQDKSPSLSVTEKGGKVLAHCFGGCSQTDVIDALRSRGLWPERERPEWTPAERRDWARKRAEFERDFPNARYWRRAILRLLEQTLTIEKSKLFDPTEGPADFDLVRDYERMLDRIRRAGDEALVSEFRDWRREMPRECAGLVRWARDRERLEVRALATYFAQEGL